MNDVLGESEHIDDSSSHHTSCKKSAESADAVESREHTQRGPGCRTLFKVAPDETHTMECRERFRNLMKGEDKAQRTPEKTRMVRGEDGDDEGKEGREERGEKRKEEERRGRRQELGWRMRARRRRKRQSEVTRGRRRMEGFRSGEEESGRRHGDRGAELRNDEAWDDARGRLVRQRKSSRGRDGRGRLHEEEGASGRSVKE